MGGDHAPQEIINGVLIAAKNHNISIKLVGDKSVIEPLTSKTKKLKLFMQKNPLKWMNLQWLLTNKKKILQFMSV